MVNDISNRLASQGSVISSSDSMAVGNQMKALPRPPLSQAAEANETIASAESSGATPGAEALGETVSRLNEAVQVVKRDLRFRVDDDSGRTIITVLDSETEEVIRQIPPEQVLTLAKNIESLKGLLFTAEA